MSHQDVAQTGTEQRNELLAALTNQHCRFVVRSFRSASEDAASVEDLSTAFASQYGGDADEAAIYLHHVALPKLNDIGVVDYDAGSKAIHYHGHSELEALLDSIGSDTTLDVAG